jgi:hypothetical protein
MLPGVRLWGESQFSLLERMWTRPALTVIALEARPFLGSSNQIIEAARARSRGDEDSHPGFAQPRHHSLPFPWCHR